MSSNFGKGPGRDEATIILDGQNLISIIFQIFMNSLAPFLIEKYAGIDQRPNTLSAVEDSPSEQPRDNQVPEII